MNAFRNSMGLALALMLGVAVGCSNQDKGLERNEKATTGIQQTTKELAEADAQVDATLKSLSALTTQDSGDLRTGFKHYTDDVDKLNKMAESARSRAVAMREKSTEYVQSWQKESAGITNPDVKQVSEARQAAAKADFEKVAAKAEETRAAYAPFVQDLTDIRTAVSNDLTPGGIKAIKPIADRAIQEGQAVRAKIQALNSEIGGLGQRWSSTMK
jgi:chromosome segregation ATPase